MRGNINSVAYGWGKKVLQQGPQALTDVELLAQLLRIGGPGASAVQLAAELLGRFGSLSQVVSANAADLMALPGLGCAKYAQLVVALELARRSTLESLVNQDVLSSPDRTRQFLALHLGAHSREVFSCVFLNSQHALICCEDLFYGTLDGAAVYPREVAVRALHHRAAAVILAHNHPSGVAQPSAADRRITQRLKAALALLDIRVLDHFIVGHGVFYSFAESGLL